MKKVNKLNLDDLETLSLAEKENLLSEIRKNVDEIDKDILKLLEKRAHYSKEIGKVKSALNLPFYSSEREKEIIEKLLTNLKSSLLKGSLVRIYERILDESRAVQREEITKRKNH
ncbi:MAG TPA: chorismate mutase [Ignavibacteriales bacterium]|nr:chorismate mutase [Ignavibacteriales bacterium]